MAFIVASLDMLLLTTLPEIELPKTSLFEKSIDSELTIWYTLRAVFM